MSSAHTSRAVPLATLAALGLAAALPHTARAQATTYSDRPTFLAAVPGATTTLDFEGLAPDGGDTFYNTPPGLTLEGVNFDIVPFNNPDPTDNFLFAIGKDSNGYYPGNSVLSSQTSNDETADLFITFSTPVTAVGLDFGDSLAAQANPFTFTLSDGETFTRTGGTGTDLNFFGLTSAVPISTLDITEPANFALNIDNLTFSPPAAPEPPAFAGFALGMMGLTGLAWKARKRRA